MQKFEDCSMVNNHLVGFNEVFEMVMNHSLNATPPPNVIKYPPKNPMTPTTVMPPGDDDKQQGGGKKRKRNNDDNDHIIKNTAPIIKFLIKEDEIWMQNFTGKCSRDRPKWNESGAFMCACWWIHGECFCNCNNKASHVGATTIPQVKHDEFSTYVAKVCRENSPP